MTIENPFLPKPATVYAVKSEGLETKTLRLKLLNWNAQFVPGQFVQLLLPGVGEAPFCIASSPSDTKHIELTIMRRGLVTRDTHYLRPGDAVGIRGPLGKPFPIEKFYGKDILIVATGIGIAALKSIIMYIIENREKFNEVTLLYGARFPEDLVYREEMKYWAKDIKIIITLSKAGLEWQGLRGRVTDHLANVKLHPECLATVCGSPSVMASIVDELIKGGLEPKNIYVSLERHMKCGIGKCARCLIPGGLLVCKHGPVFSSDQVSLKAIGE
jgi:sulfhydrogenase subunit gamma (sulfur reductase)